MVGRCRSLVWPSVPSILTKHVYLHANCPPPLHFISVGNILLFASLAVLFIPPYLCFSVESEIVYWGWMLQKVPAIGGESRLSAPHRSKSVFSTFLSLNATLASHLGKYWCKRVSHMPPPSTPLLLFQCVPQSALVCQFVAWCLDVLQEWLKHNSTCHSHMLAVRASQRHFLACDLQRSAWCKGTLCVPPTGLSLSWSLHMLPLVRCYTETNTCTYVVIQSRTRIIHGYLFHIQTAWQRH